MILLCLTSLCLQCDIDISDCKIVYAQQGYRKDQHLSAKRYKGNMREFSSTLPGPLARQTVKTICIYLLKLIRRGRLQKR